MDKILTLNHDAQIFEYLSSFIPLLGPFELVRATSPIDLLAKTNAFEPLLVLYDLDLPTPQCQTHTFREIQTKFPKIPMIFLTSNHQEMEIMERSGITDIFMKPLELSDLSSRMKKLLPRTEAPSEKHEMARLLIADDEPDINSLLDEIFQSMGIEVFPATNGREAVRIFSENTCNLAIVDLAMPEMDGVELLKVLQQSANPPKAIIILTAALGHTIDHLKRLGYPVIAKPMDVEILEREVLDACNKHGLTFKKSA